jgi:hypothetical protein
MSTMIRVSDETRERVLRVAAEDFGGVTADEAVQRLLDIHWQSKVIAAVVEYQHDDPAGWAEYLSEGAEWDSAQPAVMDPWDEGKPS